MNVHLELLLYSFSVVCRGHFMKYYDHYILAQGGIHDITAFAVAFNFNFFYRQIPLISCVFFLRLTHVVFPIAHGLHVFMSFFSLCWLVGCTFTGLHGPRMLGIVGGPHNFSLVIPFI